MVVAWPLACWLSRSIWRRSSTYAGLGTCRPFSHRTMVSRRTFNLRASSCCVSLHFRRKARISFGLKISGGKDGSPLASIVPDLLSCAKCRRGRQGRMKHRCQCDLSPRLPKDCAGATQSVSVLSKRSLHYSNCYFLTAVCSSAKYWIRA